MHSFLAAIRIILYVSKLYRQWSRNCFSVFTRKCCSNSSMDLGEYPVLWELKRKSSWLIFLFSFSGSHEIPPTISFSSLHIFGHFAIVLFNHILPFMTISSSCHWLNLYIELAPLFIGSQFCNILQSVLNKIWWVDVDLYRVKGLLSFKKWSYPAA